MEVLKFKQIGVYLLSTLVILILSAPTQADTGKWSLGVGIEAHNPEGRVRWQAEKEVIKVKNPIGVVRLEYSFYTKKKDAGNKIVSYIEHRSSIFDKRDGYGYNAIGLMFFTN